MRRERVERERWLRGEREVVERERAALACRNVFEVTRFSSLGHTA